MSDDLNDKTVEELKEIASSMDIEGRSSMTKDDLVKAIKKEGKGAGTSIKVTPVIPDPPDEPRRHAREGNPEAVAETGAAGGATADQSSLGGTGGTTVSTTDGGAVPGGTTGSAGAGGGTLRP